MLQPKNYEQGYSDNSRPSQGDDRINRALTKNYGSAYRMENYFGDEVQDLLGSGTLSDIADCYATVFNESWGEDWTRASALCEIEASFTREDGRTAVISVLYKDKHVLGFCWGFLVDAEDLTGEKDMPYSLSPEKKEDGAKVARYWFDRIGRKKKAFLISELGILKKYRQNFTPFLFLPLYEKALEQGHDQAIVWTNADSQGFKWGLAGGVLSHSLLY